MESTIILLCHFNVTRRRSEGSMDPFGFRALSFRQLRGNWTRSKMSFVPEDGAGSGIVRFSGFPRSHAHVVLGRATCMYVYVCVCVRVPCAATYRVPHCVDDPFCNEGDKSRSRDPPCRLNNQSRGARLSRHSRRLFTCRCYNEETVRIRRVIRRRRILRFALHLYDFLFALRRYDHLGLETVRGIVVKKAQTVRVDQRRTEKFR